MVANAREKSRPRLCFLPVRSPFLLWIVPLPVLQCHICHGVPGIVNADKQQYQRDTRDHEQCPGGMPVQNRGGYKQSGVGGQRKGGIPEPVGGIGRINSMARMPDVVRSVDDTSSSA